MNFADKDGTTKVYILVHSWIATGRGGGALGLRKFVILRHDFFGSDSKLMGVVEFFPADSRVLRLFWS